MIYSRCVALCIADRAHLRRGVDNPATGASVHAKTIYALRPASLILFSMCFDCFLLWPDQSRIQKKELQEFRSYRMKKCRIPGNHDDRNNILALYSATPVTPELLQLLLLDSGFWVIEYRPRRCPCASTSSLIRN
jgi:hypothetical protein